MSGPLSDILPVFFAKLKSLPGTGEVGVESRLAFVSPWPPLAFVSPWPPLDLPSNCHLSPFKVGTRLARCSLPRLVEKIRAGDTDNAIGLTTLKLHYVCPPVAS
ncbi:hypothetical protein PUN28_011153 [Cardiocondyla obscurior]|uniref:Uncharacterized protein n=1 Tax=Cardiocondyla obscurior TaxID=286306 RepID=A0AAW2FJG8_9HYME